MYAVRINFNRQLSVKKARIESAIFHLFLAAFCVPVSFLSIIGSVTFDPAVNIGFLSGMLFAVPFGWWLGHWYCPVNGSRPTVEVIFTSNIVSLLTAMSSGLTVGILSPHFSVWMGLLGALMAWFFVFPFVLVIGGIGGMILRHRHCKPPILTVSSSHRAIKDHTL